MTRTHACLAVQSVFTDRRAYVNALTYELETSDKRFSKSQQAKRYRRVQSRKQRRGVPDGSKKKFNFRNWRKDTTKSVTKKRG